MTAERRSFELNQIYLISPFHTIYSQCSTGCGNGYCLHTELKMMQDTQDSPSIRNVILITYSIYASMRYPQISLTFPVAYIVVLSLLQMHVPLKRMCAISTQLGHDLEVILEL